MKTTIFHRLILAGTACVMLTACSSMTPSSSRVFTEEMKWEDVSRAGLSSSEGVVAAKDGKIYLSEIPHPGETKSSDPRGTLWRYDPASGLTVKYMEPSGISIGLHVDRNGDLIIAQGATGGGRAIVRRNLTTDATTVVADSYQGKRLSGPNDVTSDARGRIYFTDARYFGDEPIELPNALYRVDPDGRIAQLSTDIYRPNGIEVSPDGKRLYASASNPMGRLVRNPLGPHQDRFGLKLGGVVVYDLDNDGNISNGRVFYRNDELLTDGMTMDTDGNLYVAAHNSNRQPPTGEIVVLSQTGEVLVKIAAPEGLRPTNLGFGRGLGASSLYVTNLFQWRLLRIKTVRRGHYFE